MSFRLTIARWSCYLSDAGLPRLAAFTCSLFVQGLLSFDVVAGGEVSTVLSCVQDLAAIVSIIVIVLLVGQLCAFLLVLKHIVYVCIIVTSRCSTSLPFVANDSETRSATRTALSLLS